MIRFLADENFDNEILRGVRRRAAEVDYIALTHDVNTMRRDFYDRVNADLPVPGVFLIHGTKPIGQVIDALELILRASDESEWRGKIEYIPWGS